ncbi:OsmC family protein [Aliifodinibius sp. S!AR15-10]|uniref:OsmC family protein n=1 Tax=Aliifodinibius sp. S!AR15-10 TaxID=2950437 RepID=UPI0028589AA6|nr:OsmC family protein [Aliifodinibius sp. S!AR15-10]MDR8389950.1 OsmC family protein [Aliifodinibius sp. S!AR15-10]
MSGTCQTLDIETYSQTKEAVSEDPEKGKGKFESVTIWKDGAVAVNKARSFEITTDEPKPLGGGDTGIDPMELLLASLGSCLTIGWVTNANFHDIDYKNLKIKVSAPYDLRGYLDIDDGVRPGFPEINYEVEVETDADEETLQQIKAAAEKNSPMFDNVANGAPISGTVNHSKAVSS